MKVQARQYMSLLPHEAAGLIYAIDNRGYRYSFADIIDPTRLLPLTSAVTILPSGLYLGQTFTMRRNNGTFSAGDTFRLVRAASASWITALAGQPVGWQAVGDEDYVQNDFGTAAPAVARGVIPAGISPVPIASQYFWMQISGEVTVIIPGAETDGQAVKWSDDNDVDACAAATDVPLGYVSDAANEQIRLCGG